MARYRAAVLAKEFDLKPWEIARLTDRQIAEIYFHPRDEHGALVHPSRPVTAADYGTRYVPCATLEDELKQFEELRATLAGPDGKAKTGLSAENVAQCVADIRAKWASGERAERRRKWEQEQARGGPDGPA